MSAFGRRREDAIVSAGAAAFTKERVRQITQEGWTPVHDQAHKAGELTQAASCYASEAQRQLCHPSAVGHAWPEGTCPPMWPWGPQWWKPSADPKRNLEKAGALLAAEYDRLS